MTNNSLKKGFILSNRYEIEEEIGRGGIAIVYSALDKKLDLKIAIKLLVPPPASAQIFKERMRREVSFIRNLEHKNIVSTYDFAEEGSSAYIVMQKIVGENLEEKIQRCGSLSEDEIRKIGIEIGSALSFAHSHSILHRDVKPSNIILDKNNTAYLADFGSAHMEGQNTITSNGSLVGTMNYLAPELFTGQRADARADIYALGLALYYSLLNKMPEHNAMTGIITPAEDGHNPKLFDARLDQNLCLAIAKCTRTDPRNRFQTAEELKLALDGELILSVDTDQNQNCLLCNQTSTLGMSICLSCSENFTDRTTHHLIIMNKVSGKKKTTTNKGSLRSIL